MIYMAIGYIPVFVAGVLIGGIGALRCVRFGICAAYEAREGSTGLDIDHDASLEVAAVAEREKELK